jgi:hypothetical protein
MRRAKRRQRLCQQLHVLAAPRRADLNGKHMQSEIQVLAEFAVADHLLQVAIRRGDHPHVHLDGFVPPSGSNSLL